MKVFDKKRDIESNIQKTGNSSKIADERKIIHILSDTLYSDKPAAVIREIISNAYDIHKEIGQTKPFDVVAPTKINPYLQIRDFGTGLSEDDVQRFFGMYGDSTKDHSSSSIGGFGIGSKSPYAYTDMFTIKSYFNGKEISFICYKSDYGDYVTQKSSEENTNEPNGLSVIVPVKQNDIYSFHYSIKETLKTFETNTYKTFGLSVEPIQYLYENENYAELKDKTESSYVTVGPIKFPLSFNVIDDDKGQYGKFRNGFELRFNIEDITLPPSRENIEYKDKTIKNIRERLDLIKAESINIVLDDLKKYDGWEKLCRFHDYHLTSNTYKVSDLSLQYSLDFKYSYIKSSNYSRKLYIKHDGDKLVPANNKVFIIKEKSFRFHKLLNYLRDEKNIQYRNMVILDNENKIPYGTDTKKVFIQSEIKLPEEYIKNCNGEVTYSIKRIHVNNGSAHNQISGTWKAEKIINDLTDCIFTENKKSYTDDEIRDFELCKKTNKTVYVLSKKLKQLFEENSFEYITPRQHANNIIDNYNLGELKNDAYLIYNILNRKEYYYTISKSDIKNRFLNLLKFYTKSRSRPEYDRTEETLYEYGYIKASDYKHYRKFLKEQYKFLDNFPLTNKLSTKYITRYYLDDHDKEFLTKLLQLESKQYE